MISTRAKLLNVINPDIQKPLSLLVQIFCLHEASNKKKFGLKEGWTQREKKQNSLVQTVSEWRGCTKAQLRQIDHFGL